MREGRRKGSQGRAKEPNNTNKDKLKFTPSDVCSLLLSELGGGGCGCLVTRSQGCCWKQPTGHPHHGGRPSPSVNGPEVGSPRLGGSKQERRC